jgi:hypothetical protein
MTWEIRIAIAGTKVAWSLISISLMSIAASGLCRATLFQLVTGTSPALTREMRGIETFHTLPCRLYVAACTASAAIKPERIEPRSTCAITDTRNGDG